MSFGRKRRSSKSILLNVENGDIVEHKKSRSRRGSGRRGSGRRASGRRASRRNQMSFGRKRRSNKMFDANTGDLVNYKKSRRRSRGKKTTAKRPLNRVVIMEDLNQGRRRRRSKRFGNSVGLNRMMGNYSPALMNTFQGYTGAGDFQRSTHLDGIPINLRNNFYT